MEISSGTSAEELDRDEQMLERVLGESPVLVRWYRVSDAAVVLGFSQHRSAENLVDRDRAHAAGVHIVVRRSGGGAVLLDSGMLCCALAVSLPHAEVPDDLTESYRWVGTAISDALNTLGAITRVVPVVEARTSRRIEQDNVPGSAAFLDATCYAGLSPFEVVTSRAKVVGLAQVRRRRAVLYQVGVLLRDQSRLADIVATDDPAARMAYRKSMQERSVGLRRLLGPACDVNRVASLLDAELRSSLGAPLGNFRLDRGP